ncbi:Nitrate reductase (NADPH) [Lasiodiplodia hormozganensis]|uniref:Nitrate reductase n=1 Tax=Lasiodiplodia hormozganensis TaxID=869390 RepID=A0AA39WZE3_9PEZI|nr:Nitrate reductase (NADPH) [Lasiodiplodia hormozganensis]
MAVEPPQKNLVSVHLPPSPPETIYGESSTPALVEFPLPPPRKPVQVLDADKKTPDAHVPRDPRLIRLTGVHPFNVEAPLSDLYNEGFLTSPELFYVRNHGAVPEVRDEEIPDWEFTVEGLVEKPLRITLKELLSDYDNVTYPITLVCAGNRRKEQNVVRKTQGFSWGAAGVSTALWTGVVMGDVLRRARPLRKAKYVCMEGADRLPNGYYGTSVKLNWALDPNRGMLLAHKMNGEMLTPDHGRPLRCVIPGQIGGRSVKWLKKLIVTDAPSDNWYHIYDNRVLPTMVSPDDAANDPNWWKDERYAIYDLSTNSAVAYPAHDERLSVSGASGGPETYSVKGYAYAGGGRRVTRVEVSLDQGKTWRLANINYAEDRYREALPQDLFGGRLDVDWRESCFCWCFWDIDVAVDELKLAGDVVVRAMDESMNVQPRDMYWSVLGMMNNPWYRIVVHRESDGDVLRFEHPTQPALMPGGWMERVKKAGGDLSNGFWGERIGGGEETEAPVVEKVAEIKMTNDKIERLISIDEFRKHDTETEPWFVVNGEVYDGTGFLQGHPGGAQSIVSAAALDATDEFMAIHSETAKAMMPHYHIGTLDDAAKRILSEGEAPSEAPTEPRPVFLDPRAWTRATLHSKKTVSWDTRIFTFQLEHPDQLLGLPTGQHLMLRLRDPVTREAIIRAYTPISQTSQRGTVDVLVKLYLDTKERKGGKMTTALDALPLGHPVDAKGPVGKFEYLGRGRCSVNGVERSVKRFVMVCGGSGITPIFQVLRAVMLDADDHTRCTVLDGNRLVEDILCKADLDAFAAMSGKEEKCRLVYTLTQAEEGWEGRRGRIAGPLLEEYAPVGEVEGDSLVLLCGPEALEKSAHRALNEIGWRDEDLLFF